MLCRSRRPAKRQKPETQRRIVCGFWFVERLSCLLIKLHVCRTQVLSSSTLLRPTSSLDLRRRMRSVCCVVSDNYKLATFTLNCRNYRVDTSRVRVSGPKVITIKQTTYTSKQNCSRKFFISFV